MTPTDYYPKLMKWLSPDDLNEICKSWLSELQFMKDEQRFFQEVIRDHNKELTTTSNYAHSKELLEQLAKSSAKTFQLIRTVEHQLRDLEILVDGVDQLKEEQDFKRCQAGLHDEMDTHKNAFKNLKRELFKHIAHILKIEKGVANV
jgi:hypothetical protein